MREESHTTTCFRCNANIGPLLSRLHFKMGSYYWHEGACSKAEWGQGIHHKAGRWTVCPGLLLPRTKRWTRSMIGLRAAEVKVCIWANALFAWPPVRRCPLRIPYERRMGSKFRPAGLSVAPHTRSVNGFERIDADGVHLTLPTEPSDFPEPVAHEGGRQRHTGQFTNPNARHQTRGSKGFVGCGDQVDCEALLPCEGHAHHV